MNWLHRWRNPAEGAASISTLGGRSRFTGEIVGSGDLCAWGWLEGTLRLPGRLVVEAGAAVMRDLEVGEMQLAGRAAGWIRVQGLLSAEAGSELTGEIQAGRYVVAEGASVNGKIRRRPSGN